MTVLTNPKPRGSLFSSPRCRLTKLTKKIARSKNDDRIEIDGDVRNVKSETVAKRLGFKLEGITRHAMWEDGHPVDFWIYSMLAGEWYSATSRHC